MISQAVFPATIGDATPVPTPPPSAAFKDFNCSLGETKVGEHFDAFDVASSTLLRSSVD